MIYIIIKNYNAISLTKQCISSLLKTTYINKKIVVVDDNSTDDSVAQLKKLPIDVIKMDTYSDFCRCFNTGIKYAIKNKAEYIFIINNDTKGFSKNYFEELVLMFNKDSKLGMVSSMSYNFEGGIEWDITPHNKFGIDMDISTSGYLLKTEMLFDIGGFDEALYRYFEDLDMIVRCRNAGWKTILTDNVSYQHLGGGTSNKQPHLKYFYRSRNILWFIKRHCKNESVLNKFRYLYWGLFPHLQHIIYKPNKLIILNATIRGVINGIFKKWKRSIPNYNN